MNRPKTSGALMALMLIVILVLLAGIIGAQDSDDDGTVPLPTDTAEETTDDASPIRDNEATEEVTPEPEITEDPLPTAIPTGLPTETPEVTQVPTDAPTSAPTNIPTQVATNAPGPSGAPSVLGINPPVASIDGAGYIDVIVTYADAEGDASGFNWSIVQTDATVTNMVPGRFAQAVVGTEIPVRFNCLQPEFTMEIELVVIDSAGNESDPETFELICNEVQPQPAQATVPQDTSPTRSQGSAPVILSIEPENALIEGEDQSTTVVVNYEDVDGDATRFVWLMGDNDMIDYDLPAGTFDQQSVGTQIPVEFFCARPTFEAEIFLVVEDAQGNLSDSVPFTLKCEPN